MVRESVRVSEYEMTKTYTVQLEGENGDILPIPDELCETMGWKVGDTLEFEIEGETILIKKVDQTVR